MSQEFDAIYEDGILRLSKPLDIPEQTPVHGIVVAPSERTHGLPTASPDELKRQRKALDALYARISSIPQAAAKDGLSNRDHDAILYGQEK